MAAFENTLPITAQSSLKLHSYRLMQHDVPHFHRSIEIGLCLRGSGQSEICGITQPFSEGDLFVAFPFQVHRNMSEDGSDWNWTFIEPIEIAQHTHSNPTLCSELMSRAALYGVIHPSHSRPLRLARELLGAIDRHGPYCFEEIHALLILLLVALLEEPASPALPPVRLPERFDTVVMLLNAINERLLDGEQLTVEELSHACGVPVSTCRRLFQRTLGISPKQYILSCAAQAAMSYLATTELPITQIAQRTGFCDLSVFNRVFKTHTGLSPTQYRARHSTVPSGG